MAREAIVAGTFYAGTKDTLLKQIKGCFISPFGPKVLPRPLKKAMLKAAIVPHAGYQYSGPAASHIFRRMAEGVLPDTIIILGPNHTGQGITSTLLDNWQTPLGTVSVDQEIASFLIQNSFLRDDKFAHLQEHSIEVMLPFLQYIYHEQEKALRIVPIVVSSPLYLQKLAEVIKKILAQKKNICVLASSDFTHYGISYGFAPFSEHVQENIKHLDMEAIEHIQRKDALGFLQYVRQSGATICGYLPIAVLLETFKEDPTHPELLSYYTSAQISKDDEHSVSYAAIVFE
ncbi:AmmeMemoRadiSam system protein B [Candidatus Woesearchaeota archaeon]|nr:AmmeMemoRadiSam system protein B [Candidatus Woesearchaeota archaeon]